MVGKSESRTAASRGSRARLLSLGGVLPVLLLSWPTLATAQTTDPQPQSSPGADQHAEASDGGDSADIVVTARRRSGQLIMTEATIDGVQTDVMIDTGSDTSIGNRALQRALNKRQGEQQAELIAVTGQTITADVGHARVMRIGGMNIENLTFAFADAPAFAHLRLNRRPAILLGMRDLSAFQKVGIDFARRKVMFDFTPPQPQALAAR